jgi:hypothetical protein
MADFSGRYEGPFTEITAQQWAEIQQWYWGRMTEIEERVRGELPEVVARVMAGRNAALAGAVN